MPPGMTMQAGGKCLGPLDPCKTPTPAGPVPIPYPNMAQTELANPISCSKKVFFAGMPSMNLKSEWKMSTGDQAGSAGGVVSGKIMGEVRFAMGSLKVMIEGAPATMQTSLTMHNGTTPNCPMGNALQAPQFVVMLMG
ncbi:MAG: DUF4150 domain-containing protein [Candidatus Latescibacterota bacterium]